MFRLYSHTAFSQSYRCFYFKRLKIYIYIIPSNKICALFIFTFLKVHRIDSTVYGVYIAGTLGVCLPMPRLRYYLISEVLRIDRSHQYVTKLGCSILQVRLDTF